MKASELIHQLQQIVATHGDLEVFSTADWGLVGDLTVESPYLTPPAHRAALARPCVMLWEGKETAEAASRQTA